jgi:hypothetical protein
MRTQADTTIRYAVWMCSLPARSAIVRAAFKSR